MLLPEEVFEVAGVRQGLLVAPRTERKDLGGARPDIVVTHANNFWSGSNYISHSAEWYLACILGLGNALGHWPRAFLSSRMQPRTSFCRVSHLQHILEPSMESCRLQAAGRGATEFTFCSRSGITCRLQFSGPDTAWLGRLHLSRGILSILKSRQNFQESHPHLVD